MALWTPARTTTALWLDGADASTLYNATSGGSLVAADGAVARWEDKSGNARHLTQGTLGSRPARKAAILNGRDVLRFDGGDWLETTFAALGTSYCVNAVAYLNSSAAVQGVFGCRSNSAGNPVNPLVAATTGGSSFMSVRDDSGSANQTNMSGVVATTWYIFGGTRSGSTVASARDGTLSATSSNSLGTITTNRTTVGAWYGGTSPPVNYLSGDIAEVVVGTLADRQRHEGYLAHKWGLAGNLPADHPYKTNAPKYGTGGIAAAIAEII
jgi:hypothetical protein